MSTHATHITISVNMEEDLRQADDPRADDPEAVAQMTAEWIAAAERIGAERGIEVEALSETIVHIGDGRTGTRVGPVTWTRHETDSGETIERQIWQAAHDAI